MSTFTLSECKNVKTNYLNYINNYVDRINVNLGENIQAGTNRKAVATNLLIYLNVHAFILHEAITINDDTILLIQNYF